MRAHGIYVRSSGASAGAVTVTNAGTIYASYEGIDVKHDRASITTVTHSGAIDSLNHGVWVRTDRTGAMFVTSSGDVTVTNTGQQGIKMEAGGNGAMTLTADRRDDHDAGAGRLHGKPGARAPSRSRARPANAETQSGPTITSSGSHGVEVYKSGSSATAGDVSITTTGGSITGQGGNGIRAHWQTYAAGNGGISVTVGAGAGVTGSAAGVYLANGGSGLMVARKYTSGYGVGVAPGVDPGDPDEEVAATHGEGADAVALRDQPGDRSRHGDRGDGRGGVPRGRRRRARAGGRLGARGFLGPGHIGGRPDAGVHRWRGEGRRGGGAAAVHLPTAAASRSARTGRCWPTARLRHPGRLRRAGHVTLVARLYREGRRGGARRG